MKKHVIDAWRTLFPAPGDPNGPLPSVLIWLTVVSGLVDTVSYLLLGRVFVANMTGNVVFMAFSLVGVDGFSLTGTFAASVVALCAFGLGAVYGGRMVNRHGDHRGRLLLSVTAAEVVVFLAAYVVWLLAATPGSGWCRYLLIVLLGLGMGAQNAAVRRLGVPDLTTTVLTMTIAGIAADGRIAGGTDSKLGRRALSAAAIFVGALGGGLLAVHASKSLPMVVATLITAAAAARLYGHARSTAPWTKVP